MCIKCETDSVYEFTNKRKVCKVCFIKWFQKKVLYTIRKFNLIKSGDLIGYKIGNDFRHVVLEDVLKMYAEKGFVELLPVCSDLQISNSELTLSSLSLKKKLRGNVYINKKEKSLGVSQDKLRKIDKIAIPSTIDLESDKIVHGIIKGDIKNLKYSGAVDGNIIKPLYLFLDKEVLLYAKLKVLKFEGIKKVKDDKISEFINELEKKHPEVKRAVVKGMMIND
ncbi:MAG: hypothetical protein ABH811_02235 [archaeon]